MFIHTSHVICSSLVSIAISDDTQARLATTCFRNLVNVASNFATWRSVEEVFLDKQVMEQLLADVAEAFRKSCWQNSVCIELDRPIGWSGTDDIGKYSPDDLERFEPGKRYENTALRVKSDRTHLLAPKTNFLTIVYKLERKRDASITISVRSIYPGVDVGELAGDITRREKRVFFDWNHPGEPL